MEFYGEVCVGRRSVPEVTFVGLSSIGNGSMLELTVHDGDGSMLVWRAVSLAERLTVCHWKVLDCAWVGNSQICRDQTRSKECHGGDKCENLHDRILGPVTF